MEVRFYRSADHPDMQMEIRLAVEDAGLPLEVMPAVTGLMKAYGYQVDTAVDVVRRAMWPDGVSPDLRRMAD